MTGKGEENVENTNFSFYDQEGNVKTGDSLRDIQTRIDIETHAQKLLGQRAPTFKGEIVRDRRGRRVMAMQMRSEKLKFTTGRQ